MIAGSSGRKSAVSARDHETSLAVGAGEGGVELGGAGGGAGVVGEGAVGGAVGGGAWFLAPALGERSGVHGVVADRVQVRGHRGLGGLVVAGNGQGGAVGGAGRAGQRQQVLEEDVVEDLHHLGLAEIPLEQA